MSITDELREWAHGFNGPWRRNEEMLLAIADRIDAEHERELRETGEDIVRDVRREWVRLPLDADGVPIRVGDVMDSKVDYLFDGKPFTVRALVLCEDGWKLVMAVLAIATNQTHFTTTTSRPSRTCCGSSRMGWAFQLPIATSPPAPPSSVWQRRANDRHRGA
jgi:hypothetical protein